MRDSGYELKLSWHFLYKLYLTVTILLYLRLYWCRIHTLQPFKGDTTMLPRCRLFYTRNNNLSNLFIGNFTTNPTTCKSQFSVVNGWDPNVSNVPDDARNTWNGLQTLWAYSADIGNLESTRLQILITGNNTVHTRVYESGNFSSWS